MSVVTAKSDGNTTLPEHDYATRHRMAVFAGNAADIVGFAGGLIFDRIGAGWDVAIQLASATPEDERSLRILGIQGRMHSAGFDSSDWPDVLLMGADVYSDHIQARRIFNTAARKQHAEVVMWGGDWPGELDPGIGAVEHRLSNAARAFKMHAMVAAGLDATVCAAEQFLSGKRRYRTAAPLLPPA